VRRGEHEAPLSDRTYMMVVLDCDIASTLAKVNGLALLKRAFQSSEI